MRGRRGRGGLSDSVRRVLVWLVVAALLLPGWLFSATAVGAQGGSQVLIWYNDSDFAAFGGNETIAISIGSFEYVADCHDYNGDDKDDGIPDSFGLRASDIYIIPSGELPKTMPDANIPGPVLDTHLLRDIAGTPNTVPGTGTAFTDEIIGFAKPQGAIPPGRYAIVYDECQDGVLNSEDAVFDPAFEVVIDPNVPPLPNAEMAAVKARAAAQRDHWRATTAAALGAFAAADFLDAFGAGSPGDPIGTTYWLAQAVGLYRFNKAGYQDPKDSAIVNMINMTRHYAAIANDPPDPAFATTVTLGARTVSDPLSSDPLTVALVTLGNTVATDEAQLAALLAALEKYQGAQAAGPGEQRGVWAAAQARAIQSYAAGQATQLGVTNAALEALAAALAADTRPVDTVAAALEARRASIVANGFSEEELQALRAFGLGDGELNELLSGLDALSFATTKGDLIAAINTVRGEIAATQTALNNLAGAMTPIVATLDAAGTDDHPVVNAGGPYNGTVGGTFSFGGSATGPFPITAYAWDLDADGDFDDGSGASATFTYDRPRAGLVGLRVTNAAGRVGIAYAPLSVSGGNGRPAITGASPTEGPTLVVGASQVFGVTTSDPDGDPLTVTWTLDGAQVGTGANYTLSATPYNLGAHTLIATVSDGRPFGTNQRVWTPLLLAPDADGDGWRANVDCDDDDPQAGYCAAQPVPPDPADALVVTSTGDEAICPAGQGQPGYTLRCAILAANAAGGGKTIAFNIPASDPGCAASGVCTIALVDGGTVLPELTADNTVIDGYTQPGTRPNTNGPGQGTNAVIKIHLLGHDNTTGRYNGLSISGDGNHVRGLTMSNFYYNKNLNLGFGAGIWVSGSNNRITGNFLGPLPDGTVPSDYNNAGVRLVGNGNIVGGLTPAEMNLISGNATGVDITVLSRPAYPTGNMVIGNLIGTNMAGTGSLGNSTGVRLNETIAATVGGDTPAARNIISGNTADGVVLYDSASGTIAGNYIGTDITGNAALGNGFTYGGAGNEPSAIRADRNTNLTVANNILSATGRISYGPYGQGLYLASCTGCRIAGNFIGTNATGTAALGNLAAGIIHFGYGSGTIIGGAAPGEGNVISGNGRNGIRFQGWSSGSGNVTVLGNLIGVAADGTTPLGNGHHGIWTHDGSSGFFGGATQHTIGGTAPGEGNVIAHNALGGIMVGPYPGNPGGWSALDTRTRNTVRGNVIHSNGGLGIDLQPIAVTNCAEPTADGPNAYLNCPVVRAVTTSAVSGTGPAGATIDLYLVGAAGDPSGRGEASAYLGSAEVRGCGNTWTVAGLNLPPGAVVTATASVLDGPNRGTSEFAANVSLGTVNPLFVPTVTAAADQQADLGTAAALDLGSFADGCGLGPWEVTVDWGDGTTDTSFEASAVGGLGTQTHTYLTGGAKTVTVTVTNGVGGSASATFGVTLPAPPLALSGLGTTTLPEGSAAFALSVTGTGFASGMTVRWNGTDRATTFASATELTAQIAAADVANSGTASVTVHDAGNTATSNALTFTIANVAPTATFAAPNSVAVGSPFTLALNGATDPSPADTTAGFTYAFDCGDGSDYGVFSTTSSASCPTSATGSRAVKGTVRDQDGGEREYTATVQVVALPATSLVVAAANGPYNGTATLAATLTLDGSPLAGKTVSFALNGAAAGSATTDSNGVATIASASLAGIAVGTYPSGVSASYAGEAGQHLGNDGTAALTVAKANQTITFAPLSDRVLGSGTFDVSATASSGLAVAFAASGNCTISGATVTLVAVGGCTITASQLGDASYNGAADVARTFQIAAPASGLTAQAATGTYGGTAALLATLLDDANQPLAGRSVAFTLNGTAVGFATTNASGVATLASVSLAGSDAGSYPLGVGAAFAGDADFAASADTAALTIERAALTVTANDATRHYGEANPTFTATYGGFVGGETTAALTGTLACATTATTASAPGSYPIACAGQTATNYAITFVSGTLTVTKAGQAITFAALADRQQSNSPFTVGATASSGLAVTFTAAGACTMSGATVTLTGLGTCTVTASQAGNANYSAAAPVARSFQVTANPPAQLTLALTVVGGGTVLVAPPGTSSTGGTFAFAPATTVTLTAQAGAGQTFTGWAVDGVAAGWAPSLTITMNGGHAVEATFAATETFGDVTGGAAFTAITELASRGTIRGYGGGRFGPADGVQRAQMAALIARAMPAGSGTPTNGTLAPPACLVAGSWDCEDWGTRFTDPGGIDPNLWRNAGTLQHYQVAFGYTAQDCERRGRAFPCYGPTDPVSHAQTIAFITRAMVAKGYWVMQPAAPLPYQGVPDVLATEVRTFHYYAGAIPDAPTTAAGWNGGANRGWFARALWAALDSYWGTDGELVDGRPAGGYVP